MSFKPPSRKYDVDRDGKVSKQDLDKLDRMLEIDLREEKAYSQKKMAWAAMISMIIFTLGLFSPIVSDARVHALADLLGLFYIAQAGVVGAYMGVTAWMANKATSGLASYRNYRSDDEDTPADERIPKND